MVRVGGAFFCWGWNLASIPSLNVDVAISNLAPGNIWIGASPVPSAVAPLYGWKYGRHAGVYFSQGSTCIGYCNWAFGNPNKINCGDGSAPEKDLVISLGYGRAWNDLFSGGCASVRDFNTYCYACEQSVCSMAIDCVPANTISVTGSFYPDCQCHCQEGFGGSRCEANTTAPIINGTEYRVICDNSNVDVTTAQSLCQSL